MRTWHRGRAGNGHRRSGRRSAAVHVQSRAPGTLPALNTDSVKQALVKQALESVVAHDALLVSDASRCHPPVAAALDIPHESINGGAGERVRGALHIQTVNSRRSQIKGFLRGFRGIATKDLDSYLRWSIPSNSAISHRPEPVSRRRWPDHAYGSRIEPK